MSHVNPQKSSYVTSTMFSWCGQWDRPESTGDWDSTLNGGLTASRNAHNVGHLVLINFGKQVAPLADCCPCLPYICYVDSMSIFEFTIMHGTYLGILPSTWVILSSVCTKSQSLEFLPLTENELPREGMVNKMPRLGNRVKDEQCLGWRSLVYPETHGSPLASAFGAGKEV